MRSTLLLSAVVAALGVGLAAPAHAAPASTVKVPAQAAAGWLAGQLKDGDHLQSGGYDDHGLTVDAVWAFNAAGVGGDSGAKATAWLAKPENTAAYIGDGDKESYAGAHAKLALLALTQGRDPENFGGRKLLTELAALRESSGRYSDKSEWDNYSNIFSQSLAVIALQRTPTKAPAEAVEFLASSQCAEGSFPQAFGGKACTGSVDATGLAVQALLAAGRATEATRALDWLVGQQRDNGGFNDGTAAADKDHPINANSTGNALQALRAGGRKDAGDSAAAFLTALQIGCSGPAEQRGAITHDGTYTAGKTPRATAGAVLGLGGVSLLKLDSTGVAAAAPMLDCSEPATPPAGSGAELPVTGAAASAIAAMGAALLAIGVLAVTLARRRRFR